MCICMLCLVVSILHISTIFLLDFELLRQCGIFFFISEQKLHNLREHLESSTGVLLDSCCSIFSFLTIHVDYAY